WSGALRAQAGDQSRRGETQGAEAALAAVRDGDHRALPAAGILGRGSVGGGVPGGGGGGGSVGRRVEDMTEALWGTRVSSGTVSRLNQKIYRHIDAWRNRAIDGEFPYLFLDRSEERRV